MSRKKMVSTVTKTLLKNVIRHTDAHNKVEQILHSFAPQPGRSKYFTFIFHLKVWACWEKIYHFFILFNIKESEYFLKQLNTCRCCHVSNSSKSNLNRFFTLLTLLSKCDVTQRQKCNWKTTERLIRLRNLRNLNT